jgi:biopolymer transport protein ExbD
MPKVKVPRKSTTIDMTAMCDVAFLLLTFFILTTKFKPQDPVVVDIPSSHGKSIKDKDLIMITVAPDGKIFFDLENTNMRKSTLEQMGEKYKMQFSSEEINAFKGAGAVGVPMKDLKTWLNTPADQRNRPEKLKGIPVNDSTLTGNELADWIICARRSNPDARIAVKGDKSTAYPSINAVIQTFQMRKIFRFNFVTSLEGKEETASTQP